MHAQRPQFLVQLVHGLGVQAGEQLEDPAFVFARQYGTWSEQASSVVLIGTVASVGTLTSVMWLVKAHALPLLRLW